MSERKFRSLTPRVQKITDTSYISEPLQQIDEESNEVSNQLRLIRSRYDKLKDLNRIKRLKVEKLKKEIAQAKKIGNSMQGDKYNLEAKIIKLENSIEMAKAKRIEEEVYARSYMHILNRMREEKLILDKQARVRQDELSTKKQVLTLEEQKTRQAYESQLKSRIELKELKHQMDTEKRQQEESLKVIEKKALEREKALSRLEERTRRREELAETARNEASSQETFDLRQSLQLHRFWYLMINKRISYELERGSDIEKAFQKIRVATGLHDIEEIVRRFLTREQSYTEFIDVVKETEKKLEEVRDKTDAARSQLQDIQFDREGDGKLQKKIREIEEAYNEEYKTYLIACEKCKKYQLVTDKVKDWVVKHLKILNNEDEIGELTELFQKLNDSVILLLDKVADKHDKLIENVETYRKKKTQDIMRELNSSPLSLKNKRFTPILQESNSEEDIKLLGTGVPS
ncbi:unnamed protein product [Blepharisma stoltei]|uniref:Uncharacterized protein n=1 Tax=Blepharisma stoltei TaxID=1481888 RepID=A0AAU9IV75_9CILI|nr:unnamed protein product [Blepharisma stoltei]